MTAIQKGFAPFKKILPRFLANWIRSIGTAFLTPVLFSFRTGHFRSSFKMAAVDRDGKVLPWYTYPCIDFLRYRSYKNKRVLEFGGGQSTLWWAARAESVVTFEENPEWFDRIRKEKPSNAEILCVPEANPSQAVRQVRKHLKALKAKKFDVVIIDGMARSAMIPVACDFVASDGVIVCDNAEGFGFYEGFKKRDMNRMDFYGNAPGVVLAHCTSIYFRKSSFLFDPAVPIHVIATE